MIFLENLLIDTRAQYCGAFKNQRTFITRLCSDYLRDVSFNHLFFTNRNVEFYKQYQHLPHAQTRLRERLRQSFCGECSEESCFVNMHMLRTILVHLYYTTRVSIIINLVERVKLDCHSLHDSLQVHF